MIPKRFIRVWVGHKPIPDLYEDWWGSFQRIHPDYELVTIRDKSEVNVPDNLQQIISECDTYAGQSDVIRMLALHQLGGIYVDTDVLCLKSFEQLRQQGMPFLGQRSGKAFEIAVMGSPANHPAFRTLIDTLPTWYEQHKDRAASVKTGPAFYSSVLFGRPDVLHIPKRVFYPWDGYQGPKRAKRDELFANPAKFPSSLLCAHYSKGSWNRVLKKDNDAN